tara:strand:- start:535 stop:714 length:180 start_codon:yes stop_codon:yes gene_type:complete
LRGYPEEPPVSFFSYHSFSICGGKKFQKILSGDFDIEAQLYSPRASFLDFSTLLTIKDL